jgi:hypothetical protein
VGEIIVPNRADWRHNYQQYRYLEHSTLQELTIRARDLIANIVTETQAGETVLTQFPDSTYYSKKIVELMTELTLRRVDVPDLLIELGANT